jgi:CheY-like chemotaxis protein
MLFGLNSYKSALELRDFAKQNRLHKNQADLRGTVKVGVIDDEKFVAFANLKAHGYDVIELPDISRIDEIEDFDIILCDLMGVGRNFDAAAGGGSIIREIKKNYPTKFVIAYTGARANSPEAVLAQQHCDYFLKKDADMAEWTRTLDECVEHLLDPYLMWLDARQGLFDAETDIRDVIRLEHAYVKAVAGKDSSFGDLNKAIEQINLSGHAKGIVQSLIASAIYSIIFA